MHHLLFILTILVVLTSCGGKTEEVKKLTTEHNSIKKSVKDTVIVNAIPLSQLKIKTIDTLILNKYSISITETPLNTSIINLSETDEVFHGSKFNNWEYSIRIAKGKTILLDTVFNKTLFKDSLNQEFYDHSLFTNYQLVDYDNNSIEFNGSIGVPNTDWALDFQHLFNLKTRKMDYKLIVEDDFE